MPTFDFTDPGGKSYSVNGPDGATPAQAFSILQQHLGGSSSAPAAPKGVLSNRPNDSYLGGAAKGVATAAVKAGADTAGVFGNAMNLGDYIVARATSALTGKKTEDVLKGMRQSNKPSEGDSWPVRLLKASDPANFLPSSGDIEKPILAKTGEYDPTSELGKIAQTGVEAGLGGLALGAGAVTRGAASKVIGSASKIAALNAAGGAAGQAATDATGDPLIGLVAGIAGPAGAEKAASAVGRAGLPVAAGIPGVARVPIVGPRVKNAVDIAAGRKLLKEATDPGALRDWAAQPSGEPDVTGSPQTTAAAVGNDRGLFQAEKDARNVNNLPFNAADRAQSDAQQAAVQGAQPAGDVFAPGQMIRSHIDAIEAAAQEAQDRLHAAHQDFVTRRTMSSQAYADQQRGALTDRQIARGEASGDERANADADRQAAHEQLVRAFQDAHEKAAQKAQSAASGLGEAANAEDLGSTLRTAEESVRAEVKKVHKGIYDAIDPTGNVNAVVAPVREAADAEASGRGRYEKPPEGEEKEILRAAQSMPDVAPLNDLQDLDARISAAMSSERRTSGETPVWRRLTRLKNATRSAIDNGLTNQVAYERQQVASGALRPDETIESRLQAWSDEQTRQNSVADGSLRSGQASSSVEAPEPPNLFGEEGAGGRGYGGADGDQGVPARFPQAAGQAPQPRLEGRPPQSLVSFLRQMGGVKDEGGDLASMGMRDQHPGLINNKSGVPLDRAREAAAEAGYLGGDTEHAVSNTTVNDLRDAIGNHPVYSARDAEHAASNQDYLAQRAARDQLIAGAKERGITLGRKETNEIVDIMRNEGMAWDAALEAHAIRGQDESGAAEDTFPGDRRPGLQPNYTQDVADRTNAAKRAYANYAKIYKNPIIAPGLKTTGYAGQYATAAASFLDGAVVKGDKGFEVLNAHLEAAKNDPSAVNAMQEALLNPLRKMAVANGSVHPSALARWKKDYGPALRAMDRAAPGFSNRFDNAANATQSLADLVVQHREALAAHEKSAARQAVLDNLARRDRLKQATQGDRDQVNALLAERESDDRAAIAGSKAETAAGVGQARGYAKQARTSPAGQFAGQGGDRIAPTEVENAVGNLLKTGKSGASRMRSLVGSVSSNPDALSGLRRAGVDWLVRTHKNADGSMSGAGFIKFIQDNRDTLAELYTPEQLSVFHRVAHNIEVNSRWRTQTAIKAGSDSMKNFPGVVGKVLGQAGQHISILHAAAAGYLAHGKTGAAAFSTAYLLNTLRSSGIRRIDDLYREALLHPEVGKLLVSKMPQDADVGKLRQLSSLLQRAVVISPTLLPKTN